MVMKNIQLSFPAFRKYSGLGYLVVNVNFKCFLSGSYVGAQGHYGQVSGEDQAGDRVE